MPTVKNVGEPCAGESHARFDGRREETDQSAPPRGPGASRRPYRGDFSSAEWADPEIEWHASELFGVLHGREAVLRQIAEFAGSFEDWQVVAEELIDVGDEVVGVTHQRGSGKASGASMDARYAIVFTIHANMIVRVREYATRAEALKAVGLPH